MLQSEFLINRWNAISRKNRLTVSRCVQWLVSLSSAQVTVYLTARDMWFPWWRNHLIYVLSILPVSEKKNCFVLALICHLRQCQIFPSQALFCIFINNLKKWHLVILEGFNYNSARANEGNNKVTDTTEAFFQVSFFFSMRPHQSGFSSTKKTNHSSRIITIKAKFWSPYLAGEIICHLETISYHSQTSIAKIENRRI